ncbi:MAG: hypothetical protein Q7R99_04510 [bacterium]|nr:hypothetical protein [bacterium]
MEMSIIIPVSQDFRLLNCLKSIDIDSEIVVIFNNNPSKELIEISREDKRVNPIVINDIGCNLARIFNIGIQASAHEYILLANSDCIFLPGRLNSYFDELMIYPVVKGHIQFESNSFETRLVAELRFLFHESFSPRKSLFGPGLAFHRSICNRIGGYYFDEEVGWGEDGELSERIYSSGLEVQHLSQHVMLHPPESICHDLHIAYKIGYGEWIQDARVGTNLLKAIFTDIANLLCDKGKRIRVSFLYGGTLLAVYLLTWKIVAHIGYYKRALQRRRITK